MTFGLTKYGFVIKRGSDIIADIRKDLQTLIPDIDLSDDSVVSQLIGVLSKPATEAWELENAVYNATYPSSAEGQSLDDVCELNAITRLGATITKATVGAKGTEGTVVSASLPFRCQDSAKSVTFGLLSDFTITASNAVQTEFFVTTVQSSTMYAITVDGHTANITSNSSATLANIAEDMADEINTLTLVLGVTATWNADGHFTITANDGRKGSVTTFTANLSRTAFYTPFDCEALELGKFPANAGTITSILTPVAGLSDIINFVDAEEGKYIENDTELRIRRAQNIRIVGAGTVEAIRARLLQGVDNIKQALVYENVELIVDGEGRPPKSIEAVVDGGTDIDIANLLWLVKGGGIEMFGSVTEVVKDSMNMDHVINFSRPTPKYVWVRATITTNPELYPDNGDDAITNGILLLANERFSISDDIIIQTLYCPIYQVPGVLTALVEIAVTNDLTPPVSYVATNIPIDDREVSVWDSSRITVIAT